MKLLTITTLYPNSIDPKHGIFVENRLRQLIDRHPDVNATVIAPVPWFPFTHRLFGKYAQFAKVPKVEKRYGITVYHPRYLVIPKMGMNLMPLSLTHTLFHLIRQLQAKGLTFDLIDGHYFYPDGVAIANVAQQLGKPFTMTARGTDINLIPQYSRPLSMIKEVFGQSQHNLAVCNALRNEMIALGADPKKTTTARNGVDLNRFRFHDKPSQAKLRRRLKLPEGKKLILSVGLLIERKGHHLIIESLTSLPDDTELLIVGTGPDEAKLKKLARQLEVCHKVKFIGGLPQEELALYFAACDVSVLASNREGWANVLLESMACGTPVVATRIWGTPEVIQSPDAGLLVERTPDNIALGLRSLLASPPDREATRRYAEQFSWDETCDTLHALFHRLLNEARCTGASPTDAYTNSLEAK